MSGAAPLCPKCGALRSGAPECPHCGVIFSRLHLEAAPPPHESVLEIAPPTPEWNGARDVARLEFRLRLFAVPSALVLCGFLAHALPFLVRTFLSMWVHESGHAVAAWFCGYPAFPGPWKTPVGNDRSFFVVVLLLGALGTWLVRRARANRWGAALAAGLLIALQLALTLGLSATKARALVTFAGDGGCFVLGTLLMCTVYLPAEHPLRREWLRWGFLFIGAAAFADVFWIWWAARKSIEAIPFGEIEGVGLSDPSKLTEVYGWTVHAMVSRYLTLAFACLAVLAIVYALGLRSARRALGQPPAPRRGQIA